MSSRDQSASSLRSSRRSSRVRFESQEPLSPLTVAQNDPWDASTSQVPEASVGSSGSVEMPPSAHLASNKYIHPKDSGFQFPTYRTDYPSDFPGMNTNPFTAALISNHPTPRPSASDSDATLSGRQDSTSDINFSSYRHPYEIRPPAPAHEYGVGTNSQQEKKGSIEDQYYIPAADTKNWDEEVAKEAPITALRRPGLTSNIIQLLQLQAEEGEETNRTPVDIESSDFKIGQRQPWGVRRIDELAPEEDALIDPEDPIVTGCRKTSTQAEEDMGKMMLRSMSYNERRRERSRMRIEFNTTSMGNRQQFLTKLAKAYMVFGAPSHRIESQLLSAARILEVDAEFIHIPGTIICSFGDTNTRTTDTHFIKCGGRLSLGSLHAVHQVYRKVVHDEISAKDAGDELDAILHAQPHYGRLVRILLAFLISALICPLAFGGSFLDMWIAGAGAVVLSLMQIGTSTKSLLYQNVFEVSITIAISFLARGLSSIKGQIFCYTAISSAGIVGILPGYLILTSSLELASKNIVCGSVKMVYALIYTLFLGFGLQIGSDLFLLVDHNARDDLTTSVSSNTQTAITVSGKFWTDNSTIMGNNTHFFKKDTYTSFTFTNIVPAVHDHLYLGCYRPPDFPWYMQTFPWWTQFIIVPLFSTLSSLNNLQPLRSWDFPVMIIISCASYAANKVANHFIFQRSDVVSSIGAFVIGLLGNIYSRKMGGTAFTVMVTGVLFLVPSGLSQAGGITAQGDGIEIGNAMVAVTIGITVGLFMSQTIVYMFGSRKNAAIFSF